MAILQISAVLLMLSVFHGSVNSIAFTGSPVSVDNDVIVVGQPTRLHCNYVKQRSDSVHSIRWSVGYSGFKSKILDFAVDTGDKESLPLSFITVDEDSATEDEVTITVTDFRESPMTFGCEVKSTKDRSYGYGSYTKRFTKKLGESSIRVIESGRQEPSLDFGQEVHRRTEDAPELVLKPDPRRGYWAAPNDIHRLYCSSTGTERTHKLSMFVMGWNAGSDMEITANDNDNYWTTFDDGSTALVTEADLEVTDDMFRNNHMTVECRLHRDSVLVAKEEMNLEKSTAASRGNIRTDQQQTRRPRGRQDHERSFGGDGFREQMAERLIRERLMQQSAQQTQSTYLLVVADNVGTNSVTTYVNIVGEIPSEVEAKLRGYGGFRQLMDDNVRVKTSPVIVLNALGKSGYRVTGASSAGTLSFVWTMEKTKMKERSADSYGSASGEEEEF